MPFVLALDQGTTSSRALVFDEEGRIRAVAQREFEQHFPRPGWVEHDPADLWETQLATAREALESVGIAAADLVGIGITNQRETTLLWDRATGEPVHRAIVWQDRRTADFCETLRADGHESLFREKTGLVLDPYFSGTKLRWLLDHVDGARERAEAGDLCFGTVDTWLVWHLTGGRVHATDATNASRTLLFNLHTGDWDDELLEVIGVPRAVLPEVVPSSGIIGETAPDVLGAAVPVAGIAGDQQAALFGQRCTRPGMAKNTYGTGCFLLMQTGAAPVVSEHGLLTTVAWRIGDRTAFALEGSVFIGGAAVQWLRDGLGIIETAADVEALARSVDDADGVVLVPAFTGLGAPHWDPYARGILVGITRGTTAAHFARATLDGIVQQVADVTEAMARDAGLPLAELHVDGGAARNDLLLQLQADALRTPVVRSAVAETTALGAAYLAGLAVGVWNEAEIDRQWAADARFEPEAPAEETERRRREWARAVERAKGWERKSGGEEE